MAEPQSPELDDGDRPGRLDVEPDTRKMEASRRRLQTEEDFALQKEQYREGPPVQDFDWFKKLDLSPSDNVNSKIDRAALKNAAERAYYLREYDWALKIVDAAKAWGTFGPKELQELDAVREACLSRLLARTDIQ